MPFRIPSASNFMNHIPKSSESQKLQDTCPITFKEWRREGIAQADSSIFPGELHYSSVSLSWEGCWTLQGQQHRLIHPCQLAFSYSQPQHCCSSHVLPSMGGIIEPRAKPTWLKSHRISTL